KSRSDGTFFEPHQAHENTIAMNLRYAGLIPCPTLKGFKGSSTERKSAPTGTIDNSRGCG
ncbi:MAG: hypothetical protein ACOCTU_06125, partial [Bacteroidota bacterium]